LREQKSEERYCVGSTEVRLERGGRERGSSESSNKMDAMKIIKNIY